MQLARLVGPRLPESTKRGVRRVMGRRFYEWLPEWHREAVGGRWEEMGTLQASFLIAEGLRPEHRLLDVGCGSLRAGLHLMRHLEPGHYYGIDANADLLAAGRVELERAGLAGRRPSLLHDSEFRVEAFGETFDFALAHSVFTHIPINSILVCLLRVREVLRPGGRFYATFFENPAGTKRLDVLTHPRPGTSPGVTYPDRDKYHYGLDLFQWLCEGTGLEVDYVGNWGSVTAQKMLR